MTTLWAFVCIHALQQSAIAGHLPSEGRVGEGKDEGRIGFFEGREEKEKEGRFQKILLRRKNEGRCWF